MKRFIFILLSLTAICAQVSGQGFRIDYHYQTDATFGQVIKEIVFTDTVKNSVVRKIGIASFNPFGNLPYPEQESVPSLPGLKNYHLKGYKLKDIVPSNVLKKLKINNPDVYKPRWGKVFAGWNSSRDWVALTYSFSVFCQYDSPVAVFSKVFVFKANGTELFQISDSDVNINDFLIGQGGGFCCYTYGIGGPDTNILAPGIRIINMKEGRKYIDIQGDIIKFDVIAPDMVYVIYPAGPEKNKDDRWLRAIDLMTGKGYAKKYSLLRGMEIEGFTATGVVFRDGKIDKWETDFSREELSWKKWEEKQR